MATQSGKRDDLLNAALKLIAGQGFHAAPMSQIAEEANIGVGTIYRYFKNK
ncbi:MAG: TetR/AcrR family transcriptional regulator, partial [Treponema sp.]|nr:TetR/AcrR family transcriptional regulator [Treponema sp.]